MSKRTFIPPWKPRNDFNGNRSRRDGQPKYGNIRGRGAGLPSMHNMRIRSFQGGNERDNGNEQTRWYGNHSGYEAGDADRRQTKMTRGRLTQRVGMFRNAKQSDIVYNDFSSTVRRAANRDIETIIAPEADVEWAARVPHARGRQSNSQQEDDHHRTRRRSRSRSRRDEEGHREYHRDHDRDGHRTHVESYNYRTQRVPQVRIRQDAYENGYLPTGTQYEYHAPHSQHWQDDTRQPACNLRSRAPHVEQQAVERRYRDDASDRCGDRSCLTTELQTNNNNNHRERVAIIRQQEHIARTPGLEDTVVSSLSSTTNASSTAFPSEQLAARILSALPPSSLRENVYSRYSDVAVNLLATSAGNAPKLGSANTTSSTDNRMMTLMLNQTTKLDVCENESSQEDHNEPVACPHDYLFRPESPLLVVRSTSPPPTPIQERIFNRTMQSINSLRLDQRFAASPDATDHTILQDTLQLGNRSQQDMNTSGAPLFNALDSAPMEITRNKEPVSERSDARSHNTSYYSMGSDRAEATGHQSTIGSPDTDNAAGDWEFFTTEVESSSHTANNTGRTQFQFGFETEEPNNNLFHWDNNHNSGGVDYMNHSFF